MSNMFCLNQCNFVSSKETVYKWFLNISLFDMKVNQWRFFQSKYYIHYIFYLKQACCYRITHLCENWRPFVAIAKRLVNIILFFLTVFLHWRIIFKLPNIPDTSNHFLIMNMLYETKGIPASLLCDGYLLLIL